MAVILRLALLACVPAAARADAEADRAANELRRLEASVVATNEVERQSGHTALDALVDDTRQQQANRAEAGLHVRETERARPAQTTAGQTRAESGAAAQRIRAEAAARAAQREAAYSAGAAFWDSLQYWTQEGLFEAGFIGGRAAGDAAFGDHKPDRVRRWMRHRRQAPDLAPGAE